MISRKNYIMWYHMTFGTNKKAQKALDFYGGFERLYEVVTKDEDNAGLLEGFKKARLSAYSLLDASEAVAVTESLGGGVITFESEYYPKKLLEISNFPFVLFYDGDKEILKENMNVAIVGSRETPDKALTITYNASYNLAKTGAVTVSGAALGADSAAHRGAIDAGGATVGVLGCGIGSEYMDRIGDFYDTVCSHGVYITEMLPFERPSRFSFPERNRIISGMSQAVLVAYAEEKSGSLITADWAKKQKRRVYAVASSLYPSKGCEKLISDGAYVFYNAGDIAYPFKDCYSKEKFNDAYCNKPVSINDISEDMLKAFNSEIKADIPASKKKPPEKKAVQKMQAEVTNEEKKVEKELPSHLSADAKIVYGFLTSEKMSVDSLISLTGLPTKNVLSAVSELAVFGFVKNLPGSMISKSEK